MLSARSSIRLVGLIAIAAVCVAPAPAAASSPGSLSPVATKLYEPQAPSIAVDTLASVFRDSLTMTKFEVVAGVDVVQLSARTRDTFQRSAVDHAVHVVIRSGDVSPGSFGRYLVDAIVDDVGPEMAKAIARSYRPSADAYRRVLHAIHDRNRSSNASS